MYLDVHLGINFDRISGKQPNNCPQLVDMLRRLCDLYLRIWTCEAFPAIQHDHFPAIIFKFDVQMVDFYFFSETPWICLQICYSSYYENRVRFSRALSLWKSSTPLPPVHSCHSCHSHSRPCPSSLQIWTNAGRYHDVFNWCILMYHKIRTSPILSAEISPFFCPLYPWWKHWHWASAPVNFCFCCSYLGLSLFTDNSRGEHEIPSVSLAVEHHNFE